MGGKRVSERGSALLVAMGVALVLLTIVAGLFVMAGAERRRASVPARQLQRVGCAQAGLQLARSYYLAHYGDWGAYLSNPKVYDPIKADWMSTAAGCVSGCGASNPTDATFQTTNKSLFFDLDGDSKADVYIYIRDNEDEMPPAANSWIADHDLSVFVGSVCVSSTLTPLGTNGKPDPSQLNAEALLTYHPTTPPYSQAANGPTGDGNVNKSGGG